MEISLSLLGGFVLLVLGGELLVRGSVGVATRFGVSPLVIGLTLVGFGTSTPELVTSVQAALGGYPGVAYGNIVGSNIANILLILGVTAIICPIAVARGALKRDGLAMLSVAAIFTLLAFVMPMGRIVGLAFVLALAGYIYLAFRQESAGAEPGAVHDKGEALSEAEAAIAPGPAPGGSLLLPLGMAIAGIAAVVAGGALLVDGAVSLARIFGVSETLIGLTIVAIGTSLPELVTSVMAALRRQTDVAFGNIVGSNIYNILGIGGATALVSPGAVPAQIVRFDNLFMVAVSALVIWFTYTGRKLDRWEGGVLLAGYVGYLALVVL
ncbi:calcium/sodium antiporter [Amaricoccus macauensis]|uniref:calcium/sodium antiporter n=1 Tax=Amaricoccus macauensis TaxID=57001 RepID=UPI003C7A30C4